MTSSAWDLVSWKSPVTSHAGGRSRAVSSNAKVMCFISPADGSVVHRVTMALPIVLGFFLHEAEPCASSSFENLLFGCHVYVILTHGVVLHQVMQSPQKTERTYNICALKYFSDSLRERKAFVILVCFHLWSSPGSQVWTVISMSSHVWVCKLQVKWWPLSHFLPELLKLHWPIKNYSR